MQARRIEKKTPNGKLRGVASIPKHDNSPLVRHDHLAKGQFYHPGDADGNGVSEDYTQDVIEFLEKAKHQAERCRL